MSKKMCLIYPRINPCQGFAFCQTLGLCLHPKSAPSTRSSTSTLLVFLGKNLSAHFHQSLMTSSSRDKAKLERLKCCHFYFILQAVPAERNVTSGIVQLNKCTLWKQHRYILYLIYISMGNHVNWNSYFCSFYKQKLHSKIVPLLWIWMGYKFEMTFVGPATA